MFEHITEATVSEFSEDDILSAAETLNRCIEDAETALALIKAELAKRVDSMDLAGKFEHNGWKYNLEDGRTTWSYPASIVNLQKQLKAAQAEARGNGSAIAKQGEPFWKISKAATT